MSLISKCLYLTKAAEQSIAMTAITANLIILFRFSLAFSSSKFFKLNYLSCLSPTFYILDFIPFFASIYPR